MSRYERIQYEMEKEQAIIDRQSRGKKVEKNSQKKLRSRRCLFDKLPLPFLSLLCKYLDGRDLQRCWTVFNWDERLKDSEAARCCLRKVTETQRQLGYPRSGKMRKHRFYVSKCFNCEKTSKVRFCADCKKNPVCDECDPFDEETMYGRAYCVNCLSDNGF